MLSIRDKGQTLDMLNWKSVLSDALKTKMSDRFRASKPFLSSVAVNSIHRYDNPLVFTEWCWTVEHAKFE